MEGGEGGWREGDAARMSGRGGDAEELKLILGVKTKETGCSAPHTEERIQHARRKGCG